MRPRSESDYKFIHTVLRRVAQRQGRVLPRMLRGSLLLSDFFAVQLRNRYR